MKNRVLSSTKGIEYSPSPATLLETVFNASSLPQKKSFYSSNVSSSKNLASLLFVPDMTFAPIENERVICHLNFAIICYDLKNLSDESQLCALLQALRWRITQTEPETSAFYLESFAKNNILCVMKPHDSLLDHLLSSTKKIKEYTLRLINAMAYKKIGRDYLLLKESIVILVLKILYTEKNNSSLRQACLSLLQKLSLRKNAQLCMISYDMIKWILKVLTNEIQNVDEEMIEFCTGIAMNLSVRSAAKAKFEEIKSELLHEITKYLNSKNINVIKYVNCLLYTLLSYESFRSSAKKMGIDKLLKNIRGTIDESMQKYIDVIGEQFEGTEDCNSSLVSEIESDDTYVVIDDDMDDIINEPKILKGIELLKNKYENKDIDNSEKVPEGGFQSRDKIPRTPYN